MSPVNSSSSTSIPSARPRATGAFTGSTTAPSTEHHSTTTSRPAPADGFYDLYLQGVDTNPINYQFEVTDLTDAPVAPSGLNSPKSGSLLVGGTSSYSFNVTFGQTIESLLNS